MSTTRATVTLADEQHVGLLLDDGTRRSASLERVRGVRRLATGQRLLVELDGDGPDAVVVGARLDTALLAVQPPVAG